MWYGSCFLSQHLGDSGRQTSTGYRRDWSTQRAPGQSELQSEALPQQTRPKKMINLTSTSHNLSHHYLGESSLGTVSSLSLLNESWKVQVHTCKIRVNIIWIFGSPYQYHGGLINSSAVTSIANNASNDLLQNLPTCLTPAKCTHVQHTGLPSPWTSLQKAC